MVTSIMGLLAAMAIPNYSRVTERARVARAIGDISVLGQEITEFNLTTDAYPSSLADIGRGGMLDPWGNAYQYLEIAGTGKAGFRKDKFLVPINSDFDLYSMGPDGVSAGALNAKASRDDVIRANDGGFVGVAEAF